MAVSGKGNTVRIIGGKWRSRKVTFASAAIRPSPDRVRETLFNWLQANIAGAKCLDLYAGSGALSLEALSRGAAHVTLIDQDAQTVQHLRAVFADFCDDDASHTIVNDEAEHWMADCTERFDLVFIDPPFAADALESALKQAHHLCKPGALVYVESGAPILEPPDGYAIHRQGKAGDVHYGLLRRNA